ncbi:MAG: hypothetical protein AVDCRST_MAG76-1241 [uncultured Acidimicrobiales bacterium]|uniref:Glycosyltransferase subfamily 4-like N-terminal domain-containing protein n=1 Tax=uncultured Acidimicrobiales bacterium TaxID=310071 RepID=A0A6J4HTZ4_9ACTN|nr:MAG: hypothetical protein AVDCRST_MAG76-1241 [uncultured Acidimicrobiales bacterium]
MLLFYPGGSLEETLVETDVEVVHLGKRGRRELLRFVIRLVRAIRKRRPQIVYGFLPTPNLLLALTRPFHRCRLAFGLFGAARGPEPRVSARIERRLEPVLARLADVVIVKSAAGRDDALARGFPVRKVHVVPNGVDGSDLRFDPEARTAVRQSYGVAGPLIGIVARLDPIKDHETFLAAFGLVLKAQPSALALVVGTDPGGRAADLRAAAAAGGLADRVIILGPVTDVGAIYSACDVVVISSRSEAGPAVLLEALACGTACASTDVGHARSILGDDQLVAPVADPVGLAAAIQVALSLGSDDVARGARRTKVLQDYGAGCMVTQTMTALGLEPWPAHSIR